MKKIWMATMVFFLIFYSLPCNAQTVDSKEYGISFSLSYSWTKEVYEDSMVFYHSQTDQESFTISFVENDDLYLNQLGEDMMKYICDQIYSDQTLSSSLSEQNQTGVVVKSDSVLSGYEAHNGNNFYRYEKAYTAYAPGYLTTSFYGTVYMIEKNGKMYMIQYSRNDQANHFSDVIAMLDSLSFENGKIKIVINNETIESDSDPIMMENRTLVPIRVVAEKLGYRVEWDEKNQIVTLTASKGSPVLHFVIGEKKALKNWSEEIALDVPALVIKDRTYLPLRMVAEAMDAKVSWNEAEKTVEISSGI